MIEINNSNWRNKLSHNNNLIITGASGVGKSTIFNLLLEKLPNNKYHFHKRYTTRPLRNDDVISENINISHDQFFDKEFIQKLDFYWSKPLPNNEVFYGFKKNKPDYNVFCCNNEILEYPDNIKIRPNILDTSLVIQIFCPLENRINRVAMRSPELTSEELSYRLKEVKQELLMKSDLVIINDEETPMDVAVELMRLLSFC